MGGLSGALFAKTSKRILNMNAVKFKLNNLRSTTIRYEVIYKNLVRDLRKFYSQDFGQPQNNKLLSSNTAMFCE